MSYYPNQYPTGYPGSYGQPYPPPPYVQPMPPPVVYQPPVRCHTVILSFKFVPDGIYDCEYKPRPF
ncbi:hypothetical protein ANCDUO_19956 [Ancylostoma duodenale]|uniref:Uncharacterized protein n=1 Tax=Ancylostoma duodenale TaxID=51022 RepID=A0A0C2C146_9BILA|nr:hypothetical protein ANCDUO_19956 [Ancylostoma duodenale]